MPMTSFRTEVNIAKGTLNLIPGEGIMLIGSCFAENIGRKFAEARFSPCTNPFGVLYNPLSVADALTSILTKRSFGPSDLVFDGQLWHSYFHHGSFSDCSKETALQRINRQVELSHNKLLNSKYLFVTFGTAWVYQEKTNGTIVANCHKLPDSRFNRFRLNINEVTERWNSLLAELKNANPNLQVIFTVSPVRHWKDTAHGNQLSKAVLLLAIEEVCRHNGFAKYFPAFELVLDDLRDYRFYADDMLHPNSQAIEYIWEKLQEYCMGPESKEFIKKTSEVTNGLNHRPFNPNNTQYKQFLESLLTKIDLLEIKYPLVSFKNDRAVIENKLAEITID